MTDIGLAQLLKERNLLRDKIGIVKNALDKEIESTPRKKHLVQQLKGLRSQLTELQKMIDEAKKSE